MNINRFIFTIEDCLNTLSRFSVASSFVEYCDLRTVIGLDRQDRERRPWLNSPYIAATKRGEYLSVFEVSGAFREMDEASDQTGPGSLESLITSMSDSLNTAYKNSGHKISFVFERDPDMGKEEIEDMVAPQKRSLANTGIQLQDVVDEKVTTLSPWLVRERCWLAIWSGPDLISNSDLNRPGFPGECFICELRLPDHRFRWKHNKLFLLLPVGYGPAFPAIVDCYTSPPT